MGTPERLTLCLFFLILGSASASIAIPSPSTSPALPPSMTRGPESLVSPPSMVTQGTLSPALPPSVTILSPSTPSFPSPSTPALPPPPSPFVWGDYGDDYSEPPPPFLCNLEDRATLLEIKQAFGNTNLLNSWVPDSDCCNGWRFVDCDSDTGRVINFQFYGNTPWGRNDIPPVFPSAIGNLSHLEALVFMNNATGPIPAFLTNLKSLFMLSLSQNRFTGPVPRFLTRLQGLQYLYLGNNQLTGKIPTFLSQLPSIQTLALDHNMLEGHIPDRLFSSYKGVRLWFYLGSNRLKGRIPRNFANVSFGVLSLGGNRLTGDASFVFGRDKLLTYLDLSNNKLAFNLSGLELPSGMVGLQLNNNRIFGKLPAGFVDMGSLYSFDVSYNRLCGQIPVGGKLQTFDASAYSHNKCLCGAPLPPCT